MQSLLKSALKIIIVLFLSTPGVKQIIKLI